MRRTFFPVAVLCLFIFFACDPSPSHGQSDLFEVRTPNAMIIFDTSSSMNMDVNGLAIGQGNATGVDKAVRYYDGGGNHPNSKLYQAKLALGEVLKDLENINLGFSTYGQFKTPYMTGLYYRDRKTYTAPTSDQWKWSKLYWRFNNYRHGGWSSTSFSKDSFTDVWSQARTGISVGSTFVLKNHTFDDSPANNSSAVPPPHPPGTYKADLNITVTSIIYNPEYNWYTFYYQDDKHDHYQETSRDLYFGNKDDIDCDAQFSSPWIDPWGNSWKTYNSNDTEQKNNPAKWKCKGPFKIDGKSGGFGNWWSPPEYWWGQYAGTSCPSPVGSEQNPSETPGMDRWTKWYLVDPANNVLPKGHSVNVTGMSCFDSSTFVYPSNDTADKPHVWSYFKIDGGGNWKTPDPTYPAAPGAPGTNNNHWFFINFPETDDSTNNYAVKKSILQLLDLNPVQSPYDGSWHTKLPIKTHDTDPLRRNSITSNTSAAPTKQTPLADSLSQAKVYFENYITKYKGGDAPSKAKCRGNYVILLTDGLESCRFKGPDPNYDAAPLEAAKLLADPLNVKTYVIGFGADLKGNDTLNNIAASGGTGKAYFAANLQDLKDVLKAIFSAIGGSYARSNPTITATLDKAYRAYFNLPGWEGHLVSFPIDSKGDVGSKLWDAGEVMNSSGRGAAYTWVKDKNPKLVFDNTQGDNLKDLLNPTGEDINSDGKADMQDAKTIIEFILDANYDDGTHGAGYYKGKRSPGWKLGDIYHSTPLVVGKPAFNFSDGLFPEKYSVFKKANEGRTTLIYVGANDGMLHAFKDSDGSEKFSVIPKNLLGNLKNIRLDHQFYVDSSPRMIDAYFWGKGQWRTVLISGERGGGDYYYALDITDPDNPDVLWQTTDANLGNTWSRPVMGIVTLAGKNRFVAFVGGGYSSTDNVGNTFYVIDVETGSVLRKFTVGDATNKVPAGATAFDNDMNGKVDAVYFGDYQGVFWKIKIGKEEDINKWALVKLYEPGQKNPVFYPPAVTKNGRGDVLVYFGQGNEFNIFEKSYDYYLFEIWDNNDTGVKNWEVKLPNKGEKVLSAPAVADNIVYFTTWEYTGIEADCGAGKGRLYGLSSSTSPTAIGGGAALYLDPVTGKELGSPATSFDLGKGIPSAPIVTNGFVYVSTSAGGSGGGGGGGNGDCKPGEICKKIIKKWKKGTVKSWREVF